MNRMLALLTFAAVLSGCAHKPQNPDAIVKGDREARDYYPLAVGNSWSYKGTFLGQPVDQTVRVTSEKDGIFTDSSGAQLQLDAWGVRDQKRYLLRDPVTPGEGWTNVVSVSSVERYKILEAGLPCDAPAGKFSDCVRVEASNRVDAKTTLINELTFAAGVGVVRVRTYAQTEKGDRIPQTQLELTKFDVKPAKAEQP